MKKIILSLAALGALTLVSCSEENKFPTVAYTGCQVCEVAGVNPEKPEDYEICVSKETVTDGDISVTTDIVYVDGARTGLSPQEYFSLYCDNQYNSSGSGGSGTGTNCVTCAAYTSNGTTMPAQQVCRGSNGNAIVDGIDSQTTYEAFIAAQAALSRACQ